MKRYDKYKDSGIDWIGEIPEHWDIKKIKHKCYVKARVGWKGLKSSEFLSDGYSYLITGTDFKKDKIDWNNCYHIDQDRYEEDPFIQLKNKDLLITKDGTIGKLAVVSGLEKPACLNSGIFVVRSLKNNFTTRFLFWILKSNSFKQFNEYTSYGSTIQHLYQNVFIEFWYPFPTILEQEAIASYLNRKTAEIDKLIAQKERLIELYEEEKTAIINQAVTKGINPDVKLKDSGIDWLGDIPEHWEVMKLKYVANIVLGKMLTNNDKGNYHKRKYLRAANIEWINVNLNDVKEMWFSGDELERLRLKNNDLLVSEGGEVGRTCIWKGELNECYIQNSVHKITFYSQNDPIYFLNQFLIMGYKGFFDSIVNRISIAHLTVEKIKEISLICPSFKEQTAIVQHIETESDRINAKIAKTKKLIALQKEYRTALISEVVTGKIKVPQVS